MRTKLIPNTFASNSRGGSRESFLKNKFRVAVKGINAAYGHGEYLQTPGNISDILRDINISRSLVTRMTKKRYH